MNVLTWLARRFIAGETVDQAVSAVRRLNTLKLKATLDYLGEDCRSPENAGAACAEYLSALRKISAAGLDCDIALKLSQLGLCLSADLAKRHLENIVSEAGRLSNFVWIDMEGSALTQQTLDLFAEVRARHSNVGVALQACLRRSASDVASLLIQKAHVRLCKGAYKEPVAIALTDKKEVDANFDRLVAELVKAPGVAFATHDDVRITRCIAAAEASGLGKANYEIHMLYGLRQKRLEALAAEGYQARVYVPYGSECLSYFLRRLRERKENWLFVVKNLFQ